MSAPFYEVGKYACKITSQALAEAKTGTAQFVLQFTVMGKVDLADPSRYIPAPAQYTRTFYRAITEKTMEYFAEDLRSLGFSGDSFRNLDPETDGFHDFRGQDVDMWCSHEKDQEGNDREKWSIARTAPPLDVKLLESKKVRELDNLFGKHLKGLKSNSAPAKQQQPAHTAAPAAFNAADEDVPF